MSPSSEGALSNGAFDTYRLMTALVVSDAVVQSEVKGRCATGNIRADDAGRPVIRPRSSGQLPARRPQYRFHEYTAYPVSTGATANG